MSALREGFEPPSPKGHRVSNPAPYLAWLSQHAKSHHIDTRNRMSAATGIVLTNVDVNII